MPTLSRRKFITTASAGAASLGFWTGVSRATESDFLSSLERPVVAYIGTGLRYHELLEAAMPLCRCAALCDVDRRNLREAREFRGELYAEHDVAPMDVALYDDYRRVLDRKDIDAVIIATPDHWHTKIAIDAMRAGKDVYCEKPLTLTIAEGRQILQVLEETNRVFQVGTQQRSKESFQIAAALVRQGRIGTPRRLTCAIGGAPTSAPLPVRGVPAELNWDQWLGQAPSVDYRQASAAPDDDEYGSEFPHGRAHAHFRWWYEYAGGKLTDWGAHHIDIAMWALNKSTAGVGNIVFDPIHVKHPTPLDSGIPTLHDRFNTATEFHLRATFEDGIEMDIRHEAEDLGFENGILFQGDQGRHFVNRERLTGKPVELLDENPLPSGAFDDLYAARAEIEDDEGTRKNMLNFLQCVKSRRPPISDVASHHRHLTVCHAANITLRLGRKLTFDSRSERFVADEQAQSMVSREQRKGFETDV